MANGETLPSHKQRKSYVYKSLIQFWFLLHQSLYLKASRSNGYYNILLRSFIRFIQEKLMFHKYGCIFLASKIKSAFHPSIISIHEILLDVVSSKMDVFINVVFGNLCRSHSFRDNVIQDGQLLIRLSSWTPGKSSF